MSILPTIHTKAGTVTNTLKIQANLDLRNIEKIPLILKNLWNWDSYLLITAWLITYFGNIIFGFFFTLVAWFSVQCFPFAREDRKDEMKNKQTIMYYFCNFVAKNYQKPSYQNWMKTTLDENWMPVSKVKVHVF